METADSPALLLLDLPPAALAGIDLLSFTATPTFRGIKIISPGFHFAFVGSSTAFSERHGIWFEIPGRPTRADFQPLIVTRWDAATETLVLVTDEAEILRQRANLGTIWREGLAPYRQQASNPSGSTTDTTQQIETSDWPSLTSSITPAVLDRIIGKDTWHLTSASSSKSDLEAIPGISTSDLNLEEDNELHFLPIDLKQTWREGATGRERTDAAQDRSWALENLIKEHCSTDGEKDVVGELQFTFLMILTLNNFSCLEQWRRLLSLLFTCKSAVPKRPDLFISAISTLRLQLQHCKDAEGGLIDLADEGGSLLKSLLVRFRKGLVSLGSGQRMEVQDVLDELDDLEDYLRTEHGWQFGGAFAKSGVLELEDGEQVRMDTTAFDEDDESGEFAPLVVDLTPEQKRLLGVGNEVVLHERLEGTRLGEREGVGDAAGSKVRVVEEASTGSEDEDEDGVGGAESESENEEEMEDLEDMDARY